LHHAAHAWVAAVRVRLAELIDAGHALDLAAGDPDGPAEAVFFLGEVLKLREVSALVGQLEAAEQTVSRLLVRNAAVRIPNLADELREADAAFVVARAGK
jgi:hypothetical protein